MGKPTQGKIKDRDGDMKIIFKKSTNTIWTHSKTCSDASQLATTTSGILHIKKSFHLKNNYYVDKGKIKRDFSIETDFCVLKRYYRIKKNKRTNQKSSHRTQYSNISHFADTEVETIEENPDTSACGDNEILKANYVLNIESLMINNLKYLINKWLLKHFLCDKINQKKLNNSLSFIPQKLNDNNNFESFSNSTYVLQTKEQEQVADLKKVTPASYALHKSTLDEKNIALSKYSCSEKKLSSFTIPYNAKGIKIVSTLSMPRNFHKQKMDQEKENYSRHKITKTNADNLGARQCPRQVDIVFSINKSNKVLHLSNFDILTFSTRSLTRCVNRYIKKKRHIVFYPTRFYKNVSHCTNSLTQSNVKVTNYRKYQDQLDELPGFCKSLHSYNVTMVASGIDKNLQFNAKNDKFTTTDSVSKEIVYLRETVSQTKIKRHVSSEHQTKTRSSIPNNIITTDNRINNLLHKNQLTYMNTPKNIFNPRKNCRRSIKGGKVNKQKIYLNCNRITPKLIFAKTANKEFAFLYEKVNKLTEQKQKFLKYCENAFQYFTEHKYNEDLKVDINLNVFARHEQDIKNVFTNTSKQFKSNNELKSEPTLLYNVQPTKVPLDQRTHPTVPCSDPVTVIDIESKNNSAICLSSYSPNIVSILDGADSQNKYIFDVNTREESIVKPNLEILNEISQLRTVIQDLAIIVERFVNEKLKINVTKLNAETCVTFDKHDNYTSSSVCETVINMKNSSNIPTKYLENDPLLVTYDETQSKNMFEYYNRLVKKSTSYHVIDSESLLKVTDMTSKAFETNKSTPKFIDKALTCSLLKQESYSRVSAVRNNKLIAFYCNNYIKPGVECKGQLVSHCSAGVSRINKNSTKKKRWHFWSKKRSKPNLNLQYDCDSGCNSSSTVVADASRCTPVLSCDSINSIINGEDNKPCNRTGMGFGEGCIYCMLLWIPVLILFSLFYAYVLKDLVVSTDKNEDLKNKKDLFDPHNSSTSLNSTSNDNKLQTLYLKLSDLGF